MKNLMQKLVKAILCVGVVSVSLIACSSDANDQNVIDLDQLNDQIFELDSLVEDTVEPIDITEIETVDEDVIVEEEEVE